MYICIEGNIGAGKTTLAKALARQTQAVFLPEQFEENHLLPLFYKNKKKMAFSLEFSFLIARHAQLKNHFSGPAAKNTVADFSVHKCLWFAKSNLSKKDFLLYKKNFLLITRPLPSPDVLVYLTSGTQNLVKNIKERGRSYEKNIEEHYLKKVEKNYRRGIKKLKGIPVLEIKIQKYSPRNTVKIIKFIAAELKKGKAIKSKTLSL